MSIGLFIDGAYVSRVFNNASSRIDYLKLRRYIEAELSDQIDEAYFFNADDDTSRARQFHNALSYPPPNGPGFRCKIYTLQKKELWWPNSMGGLRVTHPTTGQPYVLSTQKAVDVGLIYYMTSSFYRRRWTRLVLAGGDGDFHEPVQQLVETHGVDLYLVGSINSISEELRPYARRIFEIDREPLRTELELTARQ